MRCTPPDRTLPISGCTPPDEMFGVSRAPDVVRPLWIGCTSLTESECALWRYLCKIALSNRRVCLYVNMSDVNMSERVVPYVIM